MCTQEDIAKKIKSYQEEIQKLETEQERLQKMPADKRLAEQLHSAFCTWNHIDGCSWDYENWANPGWTRTQWLKRAHAAMEEGLTLEDIQKVKKILSL